MKLVYMTGQYQTLDELKQAYKQLVKKYHPDLGGSNEAMSQINNEYEYLFKHVQSNSTNKHDAGQTFDTAWTEIIQEVVQMADAEVEVCGTWIWVGGSTYNHRDKLKKLGFMWSKSKQRWYWKPVQEGEKRTRSKGYNWDMDRIRNVHGSQAFDTPKTPKLDKDKEPVH